MLVLTASPLSADCR